MNPQFTIIVTGTDLDETKIVSVLETNQDLTVKKEGPDKGFVDGALKVIKWIADFAGSTEKIADALMNLKNAKQGNDGASIKVQVGTTIIELGNVDRAEVVKLLNQAKKIAMDTQDL